MEIQMKKRFLLVLLIVLAMTLGLASCGDEEKKVSALTVIEDSYTAEYTVGDTPDFSGIKAVVSYSDGGRAKPGASPAMWAYAAHYQNPSLLYNERQC